MKGKKNINIIVIYKVNRQVINIVNIFNQTSEEREKK